MAYQICVIGLGRFGGKMASTLFQRQHEVLAVDRNEQRVQAMLGQVTYAVEVEATNETALRDLGVPQMDAAIVALGSQLQSSIISTMILKNMGIPYIIARATDGQHADILHRVGADKVVFPEEEAATRAANLDMTPNAVAYMDITDAAGVHKLRPPEWMRGQRLRDAGLGAADALNQRLAVIVLRRANEYILNPQDDEVIGDGDVLVVVGTHQAVAAAFTR